MHPVLLYSGNDSDVFGVGIALAFAVVGLAIVVLPTIFYLITLQNTLRAVSPRNRLMEPGQVWLILIPLFGLGWNFKVINDVSESIGREFRARGVYSEAKPGYGVGLASAILIVTSIIPCLGYLTAVGYLICWIIYWVKIANCKTQLEFPHYGNNTSGSNTSIFY